MKMKIDKNMKYALIFGGALVATYIIVKLVQNSKGGDGSGSGDEETPSPEEPTIPQKEGLTPLQTKQEELQSLLGFVGDDIDHIIGKNTIARYNALNLGLGITLSQTTSLEDLQKIINAIVARNKASKALPQNTATRQRAADMVQAWSRTPMGVLSAVKTTKLIKVNLDKTTNKYVSANKSYTYGPNNTFKRADLGVLQQAVGFLAPYYVIFKNSNGETLLANPNDWIIK
jgi:hypothetical protein